MRGLRLSVRARLTALYAALFLGAATLLLALSLWLVSRHLDRTLPPDAAADALADLRGQFALALIGTTLVAVVAGWVVAGRVLRPLAEITATARRVSQDRLDDRIALGGPRDELRELADTFDGMLDRLQAAFTSQRRFVANASHELRTPLTVLRAEVDVTLADPDAPAHDLRAMGEAVRDATAELDGLLDSLLVLARSEAGVDRREPVDLALVARATLEAARAEAAEHEVTLRAELPPPGAVRVDGDRRLIERLVANLVENAVRHNVAGGWGEVCVALEDDTAVVWAASSGAPVPEAAAARLLEPFQRLGGRADGGRGAGLGLSIVRTVARAHGGDVVVSPRAGGGLCVEVRLPASSTPPTSPGAAAWTAPGTRVASAARG